MTSDELASTPSGMRTLADASIDGPAAEPSDMRRGTAVGRYIVLARLGVGGMGVVYAAYDPELDRKVALKLLRTSSDSAAGSSRARMLREAQAMAKLSHPNVITVLDVGTYGGRVFLAMEFVEGVTLAAWSSQRARPWNETLAIVSRAGHGLAAAHRGGLVHRDFKPDNVMVGGDGRVRVMDFGLARVERRPEIGVLLSQTVLRPNQTPDLEVTRDGSLVGTPAYMAPEQFLGLDTDACTDQFAYCVTLWEALYGQRPFGGDSLAALALAVTQNKIAPTPPRARIPAWVKRALERGLSSDAARRWRSMDELLAALDSGASRVRRRRSAIVVGLAATLVAGGLAWQGLARARERTACEEAGAAIADVWNDSAEQRLRSALLATGVGYAETTLASALPRLDAWAASWSAMRRGLCLATRVEQRRSAELLVLSETCLDERRATLEAFVDLLEQADAQMVQRVSTASASLPRLEPCSDDAALGRVPPPSEPEVREEIASVRRRLGVADAMRLSGRYADGLEVATAALSAAEGVGWPTLRAEALVKIATLEDHVADYQAAVTHAKAAFTVASTTGEDGLAADAAIQMVMFVGDRLQRHDEALLWGELAAIPLARIGDEEDLRSAALASALGVVHEWRGDNQQARALQERALAIRERILGPDHPLVNAALNNLATAHQSAGSSIEAQRLLERVVASREQDLGRDHPLLANSLSNLALVLFKMGSYEEAARLHERALAIRERSLGLDHQEVADSLHNLAIVHTARESFAQAEPLLERELQIVERTLGVDHPRVADCLDVLAITRTEAGRTEDAQRLLERAVVISERAYGPDHVAFARSLHNLAMVLAHRAQDEKALELFTRGLAIREKALGATHPDVAASLMGLASVHRVRGSLEEAQRLLERAVRVREVAQGEDHPELAQALTALADVYALRGSVEAARAHYQRALAVWQRSTDPEHPGTAAALVGLGRIELAQGRTAEAVEMLERAVARASRSDGKDTAPAAATFALAPALWVAGTDRARALELADGARELFARGGEAAAKEHAEVQSWLQSHGR